MVFWSIFLGIIAVVLLLAWRSDRRRRGSVGADLHQRVRGARRADEDIAFQVEASTDLQRNVRRRRGWF